MSLSATCRSILEEAGSTGLTANEVRAECLKRIGQSRLAKDLIVLVRAGGFVLYKKLDHGITYRYSIVPQEGWVRINSVLQ